MLGIDTNTPSDSNDYGKKPVKEYHCRICGRIYYDKGERKECERSHKWQNKKGRH